MAINSHPVSRIVHDVSSEKHVSNSYECCVVIYDTKEGRVTVPSKFRLFKSNERYIHVDKGFVAHHADRVTLIDNVSATISYNVKCGANIEHMVTSLGIKDNPGAYLDDRILDTVRRGIAQIRSEQEAAVSKPTVPWYEKIARKVEEEISTLGLEAQKVEIVPTLESSNEKKIVAEKWNIKSSLKDLPEKEQVEIPCSIQFAVDEDRGKFFLINASDVDNIKKKLKKWVQSYFDFNVCIDQVVEDRVSVKNELEQYIKEKICMHGMKLIHFDFRKITMLFLQPQKHSRFECSVACQISDRKEKIEVKHQVLTNLVKFSKWKSFFDNENSQGKFKDPETMLSDAINEAITGATESALFNMSYLELLQAFYQPGDPNRPSSAGWTAQYNVTVEKIKSELETYAAEIGYHIEQIISIPNVRPIQLQRDGLQCEILDNRDFRLKTPQMMGKVIVRVDAALPDISTIERYLDSDVLAAVQGKIEQSIERVLVHTEANRFYTEFDTVPPASEAEKSVVQEIKDEVQRTLIKDFGLADIDIAVSMGKTRLSERYTNLARGQHQQEVSFLIGRGEDGEAAAGEFGPEDVNFRIRYSIDGIDGTDPNSWLRFQSRNYDHDDPQEEVQAIGQVLSDELRRLLGHLPAASIRSRELDSSTTQLKLKNMLSSKIIEDFGILISVSSISRDDSASEEMLRYIGTERRVAEVVAIKNEKKSRAIKGGHLETAYQKKIDLMMEDPEDDALSGIGDFISDLEEEILPQESQAAALLEPKKNSPVERVGKADVMGHLEQLGVNKNRETRQKSDTSGESE